MTKDQVRSTEEALDLALEALEKHQSILGLRNNKQDVEAITAIKQARALDKMAENARELGLDYEPSAGTQVSKVWWDGERLMAKPIPLDDFYEPAPVAKPHEQEPVAFEKTVCPFCTSEWVTAEQHDRNVDRVEQKPVAITITGKLGNIYSFTGDYSLKKGDKVYTSPPAQRTWVGLTDDAKLDMATDHFADDWAVRKALQLLDAHEAKLKAKNSP